MLILHDYDSSHGHAAAVLVSNLYSSLVVSPLDENVSDELIRLNVLRDAHVPGETMSVAFAIAKELAIALNSFEIFEADAAVEPVATFDSAVQTVKLSVSPTGSAIERTARDCWKERRDFRINWFKRVGETAALVVDFELGRLERAVRLLANGRVELGDGSIYLVDELEIEPFASEQIFNNMIFSGTIDVALVNAASL